MEKLEKPRRPPKWMVLQHLYYERQVAKIERQLPAILDSLAKGWEKTELGVLEDLADTAQHSGLTPLEIITHYVYIPGKETTNAKV